MWNYLDLKTKESEVLRDTMGWNTLCVGGINARNQITDLKLASWSIVVTGTPRFVVVNFFIIV